MCECGCGEHMAPVFTFEAQPGFVYAVGLYPGCRDCGTPAGVVLYRIPDSEREHFGFEHDPPPPLPWQPLYGWQECVIPVIDGKGLLDAMREELGDHPEEYDGEGALLEGAPAFVRAVGRSFDKFRAARPAGEARDDG